MFISLFVHCPFQLHASVSWSCVPSAGGRANQFADFKSFFQDLRRDNGLEPNCANQSVLQCDYLFFQTVKRFQNFFFFSIVAQQQWACASRSNTDSSTQALPASLFSSEQARSCFPPTSSFSSALNNNGYIRTGGVSRSSPVAHTHYQGGEHSDTLQPFDTFDFHLLITVIEAINHVEGWHLSPQNDRSQLCISNTEWRNDTT